MYTYMIEQYRLKYLKYKNKYINLKEQNLKNAVIFLLTDVPQSNKKHVLLLMNGYNYSTPGGGIDAGETPYQAMEREYLEEVGSKLPQLEKPIAIFDYGKSVPNTRIYIANCVNFEELNYQPAKVKDQETTGMILIPCEELLYQIHNNKPSSDKYPCIKLRDVVKHSTKIILEEYLDSKNNFKIKKN